MIQTKKTLGKDNIVPSEVDLIRKCGSDEEMLGLVTIGYVYLIRFLTLEDFASLKEVDFAVN